MSIFANVAAPLVVESAGGTLHLRRLTIDSERQFSLKAMHRERTKTLQIRKGRQQYTIW